MNVSLVGLIVKHKRPICFFPAAPLILSFLMIVQCGCLFHQQTSLLICGFLNIVKGQLLLCGVFVVLKPVYNCMGSVHNQWPVAKCRHVVLKCTWYCERKYGWAYCEAQKAKHIFCMRRLSFSDFS